MAGDLGGLTEKSEEMLIPLIYRWYMGISWAIYGGESRMGPLPLPDTSRHLF